MNSVTGAALVPDKEAEGQGHVELEVRETKLSKSRSNSVLKMANGRVGPKSAIFSTIHAVRPVPTGEDDNTVSLEIIATKNKPYVSLEYGVTKSLYSDQWEGEFDLMHANLLVEVRLLL